MVVNLVLPLIFAAAIWWVSTGVVIWLIGLPERTFKATALIATLVLGAATIMLLALRDDVSLSGAYVGFLVGIALWAWHELMFLLGFLNGPRRSPCPPDLTTWDRFKASSETVIHHELVIAAHAVVIVALSWGAQNKVAAWTFLLLWGMRISAKLVVFFGAPRLSDDFLPSHLNYLKTYFRKTASKVFFPAAIMIVTSVAAVLAHRASAFELGTFESLGFLMLAALATLAVFEHWALAAPIPDAALWSWASQAPGGDAGGLNTRPSASQKRAN
ncbi:MAG: putative photosynthetic complex assembly protein PuhE [Pseudomonadota bacterium]